MITKKKGKKKPKNNPKHKGSLPLILKHPKQGKVSTADVGILEEALGGDKELVLFFLSYLKHDRNATQAYKFLHPNVDDRVAATLGSRKLRKVDIHMILDSYGLGIDTYIQKIKDGLNANEVELKSVTIGKGKKSETIYKEITRPNHAVQKSYHETLGKLLGLEVKKDEGATIAVQVNNLISEKKNTYGI